MSHEIPSLKLNLLKQRLSITQRFPVHFCSLSKTTVFTHLTNFAIYNFLRGFKFPSLPDVMANGTPSAAVRQKQIGFLDLPPGQSFDSQRVKQALY